MAGVLHDNENRFAEICGENEAQRGHKIAPRLHRTCEVCTGRVGHVAAWELRRKRSTTPDGDPIFLYFCSKQCAGVWYLTSTLAEILGDMK